MSRLQTYRRVILPSAFRSALPAYSNEVIFMLHGSALASVLTIIDLTGAGRIVTSRYLNPLDALLVLGALYYCITIATSGSLKPAQPHLFASTPPRALP